MYDVFVFMRDGRVYSASECDVVMPGWQKLQAADFLKLYLLRNLPVRCCEDGLEDERYKVIKAPDGKKIWEEGDTEAVFEGRRYVVMSDELFA